jgi:hypothetical protein
MEECVPHAPAVQSALVGLPSHPTRTTFAAKAGSKHVSQSHFPGCIFKQAPILGSVTLDYATTFSMTTLPLTQITRLELNLHKHTPASIYTCPTSLDLVPNAPEYVLHIGSSEPWTMLRRSIISNYYH